MFRQEYFSPSMRREISFQEFSEMSEPKLNQMIKEDKAIFEKKLKKDPCSVRKWIAPFSHYANMLIGKNINLYVTSVKPYMNEIFAIERESLRITKCTEFSMNIAISANENIPSAKLLSGDHLTPISRDGYLEGVLIDKITADDMIRALEIGWSRCEQCIGYLALYCNFSVREGGRFEMKIEDKCGNIETLIGETPVSRNFVGWNVLPDLSLLHFERFNEMDKNSMRIVHSGIVLKEAGLLNEAYLCFYSALLEFILPSSLQSEPLNQFRFIRNAIAHHTDKTQPRVMASQRNFLIEEFGTERPDWYEETTRNKLNTWVNRLQDHLRKLVVTN